MKSIQELQPSVVWNNFYGITRQPRPSKHEEKIRQYLVNWGKEHGVETMVDKTGNVIMRVPATPGYENRKGVVLQGHMDMVPQKNSDPVHDFEKDPVESRIDGDWVRAKGTTLGADNGLGLALALSVLESKDVKHGPVELLVTYDEETGMTGAKALEPGILNGDILINLDSETEGELYVGCAGGLDATASSSYSTIPRPEGYERWSLAVKGCQGGHSGMDIILCRANANKIAARISLALLASSDLKMIDFEGGTLRNAIPREAFANFYVAKGSAAEATAIVSKLSSEIRAEYSVTDPDMNVTFEKCDSADGPCIGDKDALRIVRAVIACPDGVERMSDAMPGMVETSNNMAMVRVSGGESFVKCLLRSSVDSAKDALATKMESVFALAGFNVEFSGSYSGWAPDPSSTILAVMKACYKKMFGKEPAVMAIHAGLECGILSGAYPHWDMVSCGPTVLSPHSPDERLYIPTVQKVWDFLCSVLEVIPEK